MALLNGHAVGGAIDLALACDWRIAAQGAKLRFIHNELGYCPPWGGAQRLGRLLPRRRRAAAVRDLRADLGRRGAADWGSWTRWSPREKLEGRAEALAVKVERAGREAVVRRPRRCWRRARASTTTRASFAELWDAKLSRNERHR